MDEPYVIKPLSVKAAADRLGLTEVRVRGLIDEGKLRPVVRTPALRLDVDDVEELRLARRDAAIAEFQARGVDLVRLASDTRRHLRPGIHDPFAGGVRGLSGLPANVRAFFGPAVLAALTLSDREQCCWCAAKVAAGLLKVPEPRYGQVFLALLGDPCMEKCMGQFAGAELGRLAARVRPGGTRPSGARAEPVTAAGSTAPAAPPAQRPRPAQPVQDDGGKSMVARRLREVRARQKDARRRGDQAYALRMAQMARDLERDAAVVDGRPLSAAAQTKPRVARFMGVKVCGVAVGTWCSCHPGAKRRGQR